MPGYSRYFESAQENLSQSSTSSASLGSSGRMKQMAKGESGERSRRLSLMPPQGLESPNPPLASSSIHDSDTTSVIKNKINQKPFTQDAQEEYLTTKKVQVKTTKNTERLVRRQIVLEDGRILEDEDPHIVVDTIEDMRTHEMDHLEDRDLDTEIRAILQEPYQKSLAREPVEHKIRIEAHVTDTEDDEGVIVDDSFHRTINSKDVKENLVKTQVAKDIGLLSRRGVERILRGEETLQDVLQRGQKKLQQRTAINPVVNNQPIVKVYQADSHRKIVDTEDVRNISRRMNNGNIKTETIRTEKHEIFDDKAAPDDEDSSTRSTLSRDMIEHDGERYFCAKRDEFTDFFRVDLNNPDSERKAEFLVHGPHITTEEREMLTRRRNDFGNWDEVADDKIRIRKQQIRERLNPGETLERTDALTKKPLNFYKEEKTRKKETDRWLERHFGGSEWSLLAKNPGVATSTNTLGRHPNTRKDRNRYLGFMGPETNSKNKITIGEKNLRRTQSFSAVPIGLDQLRGGERVVRQTTTTINPGLERVVYSSVTKAIAAAPEPVVEARPMTSDSARFHRSTLSLNNVEKRNYQRQGDKFLRGSTTSLIQPSREIPIAMKAEIEELDESPTRPPRKIKPTKETPKKDLFFDVRSTSPANKLRTSTSYSELARTSMMNSSYLKQHKSQQTDESKLKPDSNWKRRSYFFGENLSKNDLENNTLSSSGNNKNYENFLAAETQDDTYFDPTFQNDGSPRDDIYSRPSVRRNYSTVERNNPVRNRIVERSHSKRDQTVRNQSQQPLYRTELRQGRMYPTPRQDQSENYSRISSPNFIDANSNNSASRSGVFKGSQTMRRQTDNSYSMYYGGNNGVQSKNYSYRNMEKSDGWDSPIAWIERSKQTSQNLGPRRSKSFLVGHSGSAGDSSSHSSSTLSNGVSRQQLIDPPPYYRSANSPLRTDLSSESSRHYFNFLGRKIVRESPATSHIYNHDDSPESNLSYSQSHSSKSKHLFRNFLKKDKLNYSLSNLSSCKTKSTKKRDMYEFEKRVPMHSSSLEAQKFKTIIFLPGQ